MALSTVAAVLHLGNILAIGHEDLTKVNSTPDHKLGMLSIMIDAFGYHRIFRYVRLMLAGTPGLLFDRVALVTGTVTAAAGEVNDTSHLADTTNFTASDEKGKICQINVAGAAAPEGESALINANTASQLTFDANYKLSVAPESGDTYSDFGIAHYDAGADLVNRINIAGLLMGTPVAKDYGWVQVQGFHPAAQVDPASAAITADAAACAGATSFVRLLATGASQAQEYIGWFPMGTSSTAVQACMIIDVWDQARAVS